MTVNRTKIIAQVGRTTLGRPGSTQPGEFMASRAAKPAWMPRDGTAVVVSNIDVEPTEFPEGCWATVETAGVRYSGCPVEAVDELTNRIRCDMASYVEVLRREP